MNLLWLLYEFQMHAVSKDNNYFDYFPVQLNSKDNDYFNYFPVQLTRMTSLWLPLRTGFFFPPSTSSRWSLTYRLLLLTQYWQLYLHQTDNLLDSIQRICLVWSHSIDNAFIFSHLQAADLIDSIAFDQYIVLIFTRPIILIKFCF